MSVSVEVIKNSLWFYSFFRSYLHINFDHGNFQIWRSNIVYCKNLVIKKFLYTFTIWTLQNCFDKSYDNVPTIISKSSFSLIDICSNNNKRIIQIHIFSNNKRILKLNIIFRTQNRIIYKIFNYFTISLWSKRRFIAKTYIIIVKSF